MENKPKIYLAGSFLGYRDEIIKALPGHSFSDPRTHRQSCVAKFVIDDMTEAENCPGMYTYFPKGKERGTMTYSEIGCSVTKGNHLIVVDEKKQKDLLLKNLAKNYFTDFEESLEFLKKGVNLMVKKNPKKSEFNLCSKVFLCGSIEHGLQELVERVQKIGVNKEFIFKSDPIEDFKRIKDYDLIVAHFPAHVDRDRYACLFMGAAWYHEIPVLLIDENRPWKYPSLQGLSKRQCDDLIGIQDYLVEVDDLSLKSEASKMYEFFRRYKN